ncbi:uncharacterized protein LOC132644034 [Lycium barbarum]|uniref:uncharacterized protein LOC132644034 n=1 Tax=Lycium barbarum TaxID=112863 RepID=UPI00293EB1B7|nr:uncharacterized protein LOC132644034 [Lycium barbarum]
MDFITSIPRLSRRHESIWVIVERLKKSAHILLVKTIDSAKDYAKLYIRDIARLHGTPVSIISDRGSHYHASIRMAPFETLYRRSCRSPIRWFESRQKFYKDVRRKDLEFQVNDWVFLKVLSMKGVMRFGKKEKLTSRYIGPYRILRRVGKVAYELEFPQDLIDVHQVFHVSMLRKCVGDPSSVVPTDIIMVNDSFTYEEVPMEILDHQVRKLRMKEVASVKVLWRCQKAEEATWEAEEDMKSRHPHLFE